MAAPSSIVIPTGRRAPNEGDQLPWTAEAVEEDDYILSTPRTKHRRGAQTQEQKRKKRKKRRQRQSRMKEAENVVAAARDSNGDESTIEEEEIEATKVNARKRERLSRHWKPILPRQKSTLKHQAQGESD